MYLIFTQPACSNCILNKKVLDEKGIEYKEIDVTSSQENIELANKYNVRMGGTVVNEDTGEHVNVNEL